MVFLVIVSVELSPNLLRIVFVPIIFLVHGCVPSVLFFQGPSLLPVFAPFRIKLLYQPPLKSFDMFLHLGFRSLNYFNDTKSYTPYIDFVLNLYTNIVLLIFSSFRFLVSVSTG